MRRRILAMAAAALGLFLIVAQWIPVERTNPAVEAEIAAPADVAAILRRACYDCHSNQTRWPWYASVAPVSWWVAADVKEGRAELNYSSWGNYATKRQIKKLKETLEELDEGEMPLWYYLWLHPEARLAREEDQRLRAWVAERLAELR